MSRKAAACVPLDKTCTFYIILARSTQRLSFPERFPVGPSVLNGVAVCRVQVVSSRNAKRHESKNCACNAGCTSSLSWEHRVQAQACMDLSPTGLATKQLADGLETHPSTALVQHPKRSRSSKNDLCSVYA